MQQVATIGLSQVFNNQTQISQSYAGVRNTKRIYAPKRMGRGHDLLRSNLIRVSDGNLSLFDRVRESDLIVVKISNARGLFCQSSGILHHGISLISFSFPDFGSPATLSATSDILPLLPTT
jgi:hypothetical protein